MKISSTVFLLMLLGGASACPFLGYDVGGESPHETDTDTVTEPCEKDLATMNMHDASDQSLRTLRGRRGGGRGGGGRGDRRGRPASDDIDTDTATDTDTDTDSANSAEAEIIFEQVSFDSVAQAVADAKAFIAAMVEDSDRLKAEFVRLGFHDCVGGCDGCVDLQNNDNNGLLSPIQELRSVVARYAGYLTRADIWALAALTAAEVSQRGNGAEYSFEFFGRPTCDDETGGDNRTMPPPHLTTSGLMEYFRSNFEFTDEETVAIMGVHTLGRFREQNSGFVNGRWVRQNDVLDNDFYRVADNGNFQQQEGANDQFLWRVTGGGGRGNNRDLQGRGGRSNSRSGGGGGNGGGGLFFLNADLAVAYDFEDFIDANGSVSCSLPGNDDNQNLPTCPLARTHATTEEFSQDNDLWEEKFRDAFTKMTLNGHETTDLSVVADN